MIDLARKYAETESKTLKKMCVMSIDWLCRPSASGLLLLWTAFLRQCYGIRFVDLNSNVTFGGPICPTPAVEFTCTAINVPSLQWRRNDVLLITYLIDGTAIPSAIPPGFEIELTKRSREGQSLVANFTSTLIANVSALLNGSDRISCESVDNSSVLLDIQYTGYRPSPPAPLFSHVFSSVRDREVTLTLYWDETFTTTHAVERYCVRSEGIVCPQQCVESGTPFSCPGLVAGEEYMFWIRAVNCGNQTGEESQPLVAHPQLPNTPYISSVVATYNATSTLEHINVTWNPLPEVQITDQFTAPNEYTVTINGMTIDITGPVTCEGICFIIIEDVEAIDYTVSISARNVVGESNTTFYPNVIFSSSSSYYSSSFSFENCITSVMCSSSLDLSDTARCVVRYGTDPSYTLLSDPVDGPLKSMFQLPLLEPSTTYYFHASVLIDSSLTVQIQEEFSTGKFDLRLLGYHTALFAVGSILWFAALTTLIIVLVIYCKALLSLTTDSTFLSKKSVRISMVVFILISSVILLLALILWIATGLTAGLQDNTCDLGWQRSRDGLIISSLVVSAVAFVLAIIFIFRLVALRTCTVVYEAIYERGIQRGIQRGKEETIRSFQQQSSIIKPPTTATTVTTEYEDVTDFDPLPELNIDLEKNEAYGLKVGTKSATRGIELHENVAYGESTQTGTKH